MTHARIHAPSRLGRSGRHGLARARRLTIGTLLSLALALALPAPALADGRKQDDLGRLLAAGVALFILGKAIEQSRRKPAPATPPVARNPVARPVIPVPGHGRPWVRALVPHECYFELHRGAGTRGVYGRLCTEEVMARPGMLPQQCLQNVAVRHGQRAQVYDAQCLRRYGFRDSRFRG